MRGVTVRSSAVNWNLQFRGAVQGHTATIGDVVWRPNSATELASVGDDCQLLLWDSRTPSRPASAVEHAHEEDVQCVDWSALQEDMLVTGQSPQQL